MTEQVAEQTLLMPTGSADERAQATVRNPYVGPRTFTLADRNWYFGREQEAQNLLALVIAERLTLFYAQSGAGKSSLLNTQLIPALREQARYLVLPVGRVGGELPAGIADVANIYTFNLLLSLDQDKASAPDRFATMTLVDFMAGLRTRDGQHYTYDEATAQRARASRSNGQAPPRNQPPHVLIIDQFEELVTTHPQRWREREAFFQQLGEAMRADPLLWVVLTLREDFIAPLDPFAHLVPGSLTNRFYMQRMGVDAALEAIKRPAERAGRPFAEKVAETLVDNLRRIKVAGQVDEQLGQYIEPVQLQVVCYQLWENLSSRNLVFDKNKVSDHQNEITHADLERAGDVDTTLADFYEDAIKAALQDRNVAVSERELRVWFDKQLITEAGTRGTVYHSDETTAGMDNRIADALQQRFLLRSELRAGGIWIELVHDRFVEPIRAANHAWLQRQSPLLRAAQTWEAAKRTPSLLLSQQQLAALQTEIVLEASDPLVADFVKASEDEVKMVAAQEAAKQRERELAQAQAIAREADARRQAEALRAQEAEARRREQERTASRLRKFVISLAILGAIALLTAVAAAVFGMQARLLTKEVQQQATSVAVERDSVQTAEANAQYNESLALSAQKTAEAERQSAIGLADSLAAVLTAQVPTSTPTPGPSPSVPATPVFVGTNVLQPTSTPTPLPTENLAATATFAAAQAQLAQVQATQTMQAELEQIQATQAAVSAPTGRIIFTSNRASQGDLYAVNVDGSGLQRLTDKIGFEADVLANSDQILFTTNRDGGASIYMRSANGVETPLLGAEDNWEPASAPDGRKLAFVSSRNNRGWEIYTANFDGSNVTHVTASDPARDPARYWAPDWAPDGSQLVFVGGAEGQEDIWLINVDGSDPQILVDNAGSDVYPAWSPDGHTIVFASNRTGNLDIYTIDIVTRRQVNLTNSATEESYPTWSPDGKWIVFGRKGIFIMSRDGRNERRVTESPRDDWHPVWVE